MRLCAYGDCDAVAHARGLCARHYAAARRAHPEWELRARSSPSAPPAQRIAAHLEAVGGHQLWTGYLHHGAPALAFHDGGKRRIVNVRHIVLTAAGHPKPVGRWYARSTCGDRRCLEVEHLEWSSRRTDAVLPVGIVDDLIRRHAAGGVNLSDEADRLGVTRSTLYRAMHRRGYTFGGT